MNDLQWVTRKCQRCRGRTGRVIEILDSFSTYDVVYEDGALNTGYLSIDCTMKPLRAECSKCSHEWIMKGTSQGDLIGVVLKERD